MWAAAARPPPGPLQPQPGRGEAETLMPSFCPRAAKVPRTQREGGSETRPRGRPSLRRLQTRPPSAGSGPAPGVRCCSLGPPEGRGVWGPSVGRGGGATGELSSLHARPCPALLHPGPRWATDGYGRMLVLNKKTCFSSPQPCYDEQKRAFGSSVHPKAHGNPGAAPVGVDPPPTTSRGLPVLCLAGQGWPHRDVSLGPTPPPRGAGLEGPAGPPLPGSPHLWTPAGAGVPPAVAGLAPPRWPGAPTRAGGPHTRRSRQLTGAGSPLSQAWPWGRQAARCPGSRTRDRCTQMCRRWTGSRSRRRSARRSLAGGTGAQCGPGSPVRGARGAWQGGAWGGDAQDPRCLLPLPGGQQALCPHPHPRSPPAHPSLGRPAHSPTGVWRLAPGVGPSFPLPP